MVVSAICRKLVDGVVRGLYSFYNTDWNTRKEVQLSLTLCCQGSLFLLGFLILLRGPFRVGGREVANGRQTGIGILLLAQAPCSFLLGGVVLGDTAPGSLNDAPWQDAVNRLAANATEWAILLVIIVICIGLVVTAPRESESES